MAVLTPGSVVQISGAPAAGEQLVSELAYTAAQIEEAVRLTLTPGHLAAQLYVADAPSDTVMVGGVAINLAGAADLTVTDVQDFTYDGGNLRFFYSKSGATNVPFQLSASMSFSVSTVPVSLVTLRAMKNGVAIEGIYVDRSISGANSRGVVALTGHFTISENDYIEIWVESTQSGTFSAYSFATSIVEEGQ